MNGTPIKSVRWVLVLWTLCHIAAVAQAENHALLIGIGKYKNRTLEGPPYDVAALSRVLAAQYDFKAENIHSLVDKDAVKKRILSEIEQLTRKTEPGDRLLIYFSGHGTSRRDGLLALPLPHTTGALVPADFNADPSQPIEKLMSQLIIGRRDLRPMLERLDQDRQVLVVFDTCFSGNTIRAIRDRESPDLNRYMLLQSKSIFDGEHNIGSFQDNLKPNDPYPYQNIFYISASTENEIAKDIRKDMLCFFPTIDGNPHGVLTDALLRVLAGQVPVDTDNDGQWSQIELYKAVKSEVQRRFKQTPQALPKAGESGGRLHSRTFFVRSAGSITTSAGIPTGSKQSLRIQVTKDFETLRAHVSRIDGVMIVETDPDLIVVKDGEDVVLALPNFQHLCRFTTAEVNQVVDRIQRHLRIQPLVNLVYPHQGFSVGIELIGTYRKSMLSEDETFGFEIRTDKSAYIFLIDVDPAGAVHVLYPYDRSELKPLIPGERKILMGSCRTLWPYGTETLKLFAFSRRPNGLETLVGKEDLRPGTPLFDTLEQLVGLRGGESMRSSVRTDVAQAVFEITSYPKANMKTHSPRATGRGGLKKLFERGH
jgi:hypothetical protein